jgi:replicative DNA helicase
MGIKDDPQAFKKRKDEMLEEARNRFTELLQQDGLYDPANPKKPHLCFHHKEKTPSLSYNQKTNRLHCFGCGGEWNTFSYIGERYGILDFHAQAEKAYELLGIQYDKNAPKTPQTETRPQIYDAFHDQLQAVKGGENRKNYSEYLMECFDREDPAHYLEGRGISKETIEEHCIGFDPHFPAGDSTFWQAVIIPIDSFSFVARNTDPQAGKKDRYRKRSSGCLNINTLKDKYDTRPIWVVEGEIDALSINEAGGRAIALGSTSLAYQFTNEVFEKTAPQDFTFILALDNDETGIAVQNTLRADLHKKQYKTLQKRITFGDCKDANEYLVKHGVKALNLLIKKEEDALLLRDANGMNNLSLIEAFRRSTMADTECTPTGIASIDKLLDGGLYAGLYVIGAQPSAGKTALVLQIADNIAKGRTPEEARDIVYFSLEMSRFELIARSVSRITSELGRKRGIDRCNWKTARGILVGKRYEHYSETEKKLIYDSIVEYAQTIAPHFYTHESMASFGTAYIRNEVIKHVAKTGKPPVVVLDYLQIVPQEADGKPLTEKQNMDRVIVELKRLSRELNTPVIAISSFNRASYDNAALSSLKESGSIEYTADVVLGLEREPIAGNAAASPVAITVKVLKNRNGTRDAQADMHFYGEFSYFDDLGTTAVIE